MARLAAAERDARLYRIAIRLAAGEEVSLTSLAREFGMSKSTVYRVIRQDPLLRALRKA